MLHRESEQCVVHGKGMECRAVRREGVGACLTADTHMAALLPRRHELVRPLHVTT